MKIIIAKATLFAISFLFVNLMLTGAVHSQGLLSKAVAIWLFDEDGGKRVSDFARNKHDGEFEGKPEWVPGKFGSALKFSGADEIQGVDINRPVVVDTVDFSIGCWLFPGSPQHTDQNVLSGREAPGSDKGITLAQYENTVNGYRVVFVREGRGGVWYKNGEPDRPKRGNFYIDIGSVKPANPSEANFRIGAAVFDENRRY